MPERSILIKIASDVTKWYLFLFQILRTVYDPQMAAQIPEALLLSQINTVRADLLPVLDRNPVVRENMEQIYNDVMRIWDGAKKGDGLAQDEARQMAIRVNERMKATSDLVALFKAL